MAETPATTRAVPRSGCLTISNMKTTGIIAALTSVLRQSCIWSRRVERNQARKRMMTGLAISEGWKVKSEPKRIQRWVLCESWKNKTSTSSMVVMASAGKMNLGEL